MRQPAPPRIDFIAAQPRLDGTTAWFGWGLLLLGIALLTVVGLSYASWLARLEIAEVSVRQSRQQEAGRRLPSPVDLAEAHFAGDSLALARRDWEPLFRAIEEGVPGVALLSFSGQGARGEVRIGGEAENLDAVTRFADAMARQPAVAEVRLLSHQPRLHDGRALLYFELQAKWLP